MVFLLNDCLVMGLLLERWLFLLLFTGILFKFGFPIGSVEDINENNWRQWCNESLEWRDTDQVIRVRYWRPKSSKYCVEEIYIRVLFKMILMYMKIGVKLVWILEELKSSRIWNVFIGDHKVSRQIIIELQCQSMHFFMIGKFSNDLLSYVHELGLITANSGQHVMVYVLFYLCDKWLIFMQRATWLWICPVCWPSWCCWCQISYGWSNSSWSGINCCICWRKSKEAMGNERQGTNKVF